MAFEFTQAEVDALNMALGIDVPLAKANLLAAAIDMKREALRLAQSNHANLVNLLRWLESAQGEAAQVEAVKAAVAALEGGWEGLRDEA